jgi:TonB family protein
MHNDSRHASHDDMTQNDLALDPREMLIPGSSAPRASILLSSLAAHFVVLALLMIVLRTGGPRIVPTKLEAVQMISGPKHLSFESFKAQTAKTHASALHLRRRVRQEHAIQPPPDPSSDGPAMQALRKRAKEYTAGLMTNFKFRQIYGFSPGADYQLAFQMAGSLPIISATEVPPRFEQYLIVDIIVDVDGRVADARIESGSVDPNIEKKLLAAIRDFKYRPATRDGSPIPCQLGIVVHIPS